MLYNYRFIDNVMKKYEEAGFNKAQIKELRRGLEDDVDIKHYDNINYSADEMFDMRWKLVKEKEIWR